MEVLAILQMLVTQFPWLMVVLSILGAIVVAAQAIVLITPSTKDDEALAALEAKPLIKKILDAIKAFAPFQKK
jgi:hypothetical protein